MKSLFGKSQPGRTSQWGLTYTPSLRGIWAQCVVFQEYIFIIEARSLVSNAPTWNKQSSELFTHSLAELVSSAQARGFFASNHSNAISALEVREHSIFWRRMTLASACLFALYRDEGAPETLVGTSNHSSTRSSRKACFPCGCRSAVRAALEHPRL